MWSPAWTTLLRAHSRACGETPLPALTATRTQSPGYGGGGGAEAEEEEGGGGGGQRLLAMA
jgi:hypothetical protein